MQFIVHKSIFGTPLHYSWDTNTRKGTFVAEIPSSAWILGDEHQLRSIDMFAQVHHQKFDVEHALQKKILARLGVFNDIPWHKTMPKHQFKARIKGLLDGAESILNNTDRSYYEKIFISSRDFLDRLDGIKINKRKLRHYLDMEKNPSLRAALMSCTPAEDGFTRQIRYDFTSSKTGRAKIISGPRVLTLKKDYRDIFESEWEGGQVVAIDYKSLEARIALAIGGATDIPRDPYAQIAEKAGVDRATAKIAMLSIMFGSGTKKIKESTGLSQIETTMLVAYIKDAISYARIIDKLKSERAETGLIKNHFGRPLDPQTDAEHVLYNNFIQSTGVDVALLGFSQMYDLVRDNDFVKPKFIVHDCLYIDIHPEYSSIIEELQSVGSNIPTFTTVFFTDQ